MSIKYQTREVLADAYLPHQRWRMRTHTVSIIDDGPATPLCRRVKADSIADANANPMGLDKPPTCGECLHQDPRFQD